MISLHSLRRLALILLITIPAGWLAGRASFEKRVAHEIERREAVETTAGLRKADRAPIPTAADYLALVRAGQTHGAGRDDCRESMNQRVADWTNDEFAKAMDEAMREELSFKASKRSLGPMFAISSVNELLRAWLTKDTDGALLWFQSIPSTKTRQEIADQICENWPVEKGDLALEFLAENRKLLVDQNETQLACRALEHAALNGPIAVSEVLKTIQGKGYRFGPSPPEFPENFDFAALANTEAFRNAARENIADDLLPTWFARDGDAAFDWVLQHLGAKELPNFLPFDDRDTQRWAGGRFMRLTQDQRVDFMTTAVGNYDAEQILKLAQVITEPKMKEDTLMLALQGVFTNDAKTAMEVMEASFPTERRLELLENLSSRQKENVFYGDSRSEEEVRKALQKCTRDEARIDAIINRLKP